MADLALTTPPPRSELLRLLRTRLLELAPSLRIVAQDLHGAEAPIDFVGVEPAGGVVLVLVGEAGEDLALMGRALAQRAWVERRLSDWLQLAPDLAIRPEAGVRTLLLCPAFGPESLIAAEALGEQIAALGVYRCVRSGTGVETLVEVLQPPGHEPTQPLAHVPAASARPAFRTGLTDFDMGLSAEERREFEPG